MKLGRFTDTPFCPSLPCSLSSSLLFCAPVIPSFSLLLLHWLFFVFYSVNSSHSILPTHPPLYCPVVAALWWQTLTSARLYPLRAPTAVSTALAASAVCAHLASTSWATASRAPAWSACPATRASPTATRVGRATAGAATTAWRRRVSTPTRAQRHPHERAGTLRSHTSAHTHTPTPVLQGSGSGLAAA